MKTNRWKSVVTKIFPITVLGYFFNNHYDLGMKFFSEGRFDCALETFEEALLSSPNNPKNRNGIEAQYGAALCYLSGLGVQKPDANKAIEYLKVITDDETLGNLDTVELHNAQFLLGLAYLNAHDQREKDAEAVLSKAAECGHALAQFTLGIYYRDMAEQLVQEGQDSNEAELKAVRWLQKAYKNENLSQKNRDEARMSLTELAIQY